jgi:para-aminobenzoate synthetase component 1
VETIQDLILQGEVYEVNLTQQFSADFIGSSLAFFLNLYEKNNGPFSAYLSYSDFTVASISPEQFLYCDQGKVSTKPI